MKTKAKEAIHPAIVYLNGSLVPLSKAGLSPLDSGFLYGCGLFETMCSYSGRVFRLDKHLDRLRRSARFLGIDLDSLPDLEKAVYDCLKSNKTSNARIRLTISCGEGATIPDLVSQRHPTVLVVAIGYTPYSAETYERGFRAIVSGVRRNSQSPVSGMKSLSCLDLLLARREAKLAGADEAILLNEQGYLAEGSTSNVFLVSGDTLVTPSEDSGILPGITRETVLEMAHSSDLKTVLKKVSLEELNQANETFLTNSLIQIMPLTQVNGQAIGSGQPGLVTKRLMSAYQQLVEQETLT